MKFSNSFKRDLLFVAAWLQVDYEDFLALHELLIIYDPNSKVNYHLDLCSLINSNFESILKKVYRLNYGYTYYHESGLVCSYRTEKGILLTSSQAKILHDLLIYHDNDYYPV
jgi:hypothetical protein